MLPLTAPPPMIPGNIRINKTHWTAAIIGFADAQPIGPAAKVRHPIAIPQAIETAFLIFILRPRSRFLSIRMEDTRTNPQPTLSTRLVPRHQEALLAARPARRVAFIVRGTSLRAWTLGKYLIKFVSKCPLEERSRRVCCVSLSRIGDMELPHDMPRPWPKLIRPRLFAFMRR